MEDKLYDCFLVSFQWRELIWEWQTDGFFECDCAGILPPCGGIVPEDACNFKFSIRERKE